MSKVFLSYRRHDSPGFAGRIADHINLRFGGGTVFRDVETIEGGVDFVEAINSAVGGCAAFIMVIGPRWLDVTDANGKRRLDDPQDFVRTELASALARQIRVIPVLLEGARMPTADQLPDDLKVVARRQAIDLTDAHFESDIEEVIHSLESVLGRPSRPLHPVSPTPPRADPGGASKPPQVHAGVAVPSYLAWSIASTACLCLPLGIVALLQSNKSSAALAAGDVVAAQTASAKARQWNMIALGVGGLFWVIALIAGAMNGASR